MRALFVAFTVCTACARPNYQDVKTDPQGRFRFTRVGWSGEWQWDTIPTLTTPGTVTLKFWKTDIKPPVIADPGYDPSLRIWMPEMGHGTRPVTVTGKDGLYQIEGIYLYMHGEWEFEFHLNRNGTSIDEAHYRFKF